MRIGQKKSCTMEENNMLSSFVGDCALLCVFLAPFFGLLGVGCFISDWLLPRCPRVCTWLERVLDIDLERGFDDDD